MLLALAACSKNPVEKSNLPPVITRLTALPTLIEQGGQAEVQCEASDPEGHSLKYEWRAPVGQIIGAGTKVIWQMPDPLSEYPVTSYYPILCTVDDGRGGRDSSRIQVAVASHRIAFEDAFSPDVHSCLQGFGRGVKAFRTQQEWLDFWNNYGLNCENHGWQPEFDFSQSMVIGVFFGSVTCLAYSSSIRSVFIFDDTLYVRIGERARSGSCFAEYYASHLIKTARLEYPIKFIGNVPR